MQQIFSVLIMIKFSDFVKSFLLVCFVEVSVMAFRHFLARVVHGEGVDKDVVRVVETCASGEQENSVEVNFFLHTCAHLILVSVKVIVVELNQRFSIL